MIIKQKLRLTIPSHKIKIVRGPYLGFSGPLVGNHWCRLSVVVKNKLYSCNVLYYYFLLSFILYPACSGARRGSLVLKQSAPHFLALQILKALRTRNPLTVTRECFCATTHTSYSWPLVLLIFITLINCFYNISRKTDNRLSDFIEMNPHRWSQWSNAVRQFLSLLEDWLKERQIWKTWTNINDSHLFPSLKSNPQPLQSDVVSLRHYGYKRIT